MEKYKLVTNKRINIEKMLKDWYTSYDSHIDGIFVERFDKNDCKVTIFIGEEYFLRIKSNLTLTTIVERSTDEIAVIVINSGGSSEWGFTWGAEKSAAKPILDLLEENGFHILNV